MTFSQSISGYLQVPESSITLWWKGRVALYALLKAFGVKENDEVILPAFTCVVVPNAIIYCGAKPVYVDIDPLTLNATAENIQKKISSKTKVIIAQNTFGLSSDLDPIIQLAREKKIIVIEDCTHGFGGYYKKNKNGTICDASFFSTQWNKPFSTGIGGIAYTADAMLAEKMKKIESEAASPSAKERTQLKILLKARNIFSAPAVYWPMIKTYRFLSSKNIVVGSSGAEELEKPELQKNFLKKMSGVQAKKGMAELKNLDAYNRHRIALAKKYHSVLSDLGISPPAEPEYALHTFLKYPLLVKNREVFMKLAEKEKVELGDWFLSPIHPIESGFNLWQYKMGKNPVAEKISRHIVNLPNHPGINEKKFTRIKKFLEKNRSELMSTTA